MFLLESIDIFIAVNKTLYKTFSQSWIEIKALNQPYLISLHVRNGCNFCTNISVLT